MKSLLLLALLVTGSSAFGALYMPWRWLNVRPAAGKYTGVLTVRRALLPAGLETTFAVKVEARVEADGQITILTATPESPGAAANIENSVVRAAPLVFTGAIGYPIGTVAGGNPTPAALYLMAPAVGVPAREPAPAPAPATPPSIAPTGTLITVPGLGGPGSVILTSTLSNYLVNGNHPGTVLLVNGLVSLKYGVTQSGPGSASRVSYEFLLRDQRPRPTAATAATPH